MTYADRIEFYAYVSRWLYAEMAEWVIIKHRLRPHPLYQLPLEQRRAIAVALVKPSRRHQNQDRDLMGKYTKIPQWMTPSHYYTLLLDHGIHF